MDNLDKEKCESYAQVGIVPIMQDIDFSSLSKVKAIIFRIMELKKTEALFLFNCAGGNMVAGLEMFDTVSLFPGKKTGLVLGDAHSMAAIVLQACDERFATRHSTVLIHHGHCTKFNLDFLFDRKKLDDFIEREIRLVNRNLSILEKRTKQTREAIQAVCVESRPLSSEDSVKFGLLDGIWEKPLPFPWRCT